MDFLNFRQFAKMNLRRVVNGCMDAMEEGRLPVIARNELVFVYGSAISLPWMNGPACVLYCNETGFHQAWFGHQIHLYN